VQKDSGKTKTRQQDGDKNVEILVCGWNILLFRSDRQSLENCPEGRLKKPLTRIVRERPKGRYTR